jgi:hypothetical protein
MSAIIGPKVAEAPVQRSLVRHYQLSDEHPLDRVGGLRVHNSSHNGGAGA